MCSESNLTDVLIRRGEQTGIQREDNMKTQRHTGESHGMTEVETGVMHLQAKECRGLRAILAAGHGPHSPPEPWRECGSANIFFFFFLAALGLGCCARAFSSCGERGLLFVEVHGLLIAVASLVVEHGL